ncbi:MAG TPA: hypothetical protein DCL21_06860 [Alphaproteobacteria bacterium]|nr:hypothetical protein [Alphaproteobacteria bacterium]
MILAVLDADSNEINCAFLLMIGLLAFGVIYQELFGIDVDDFACHNTLQVETINGLQECSLYAGGEEGSGYLLKIKCDDEGFLSPTYNEWLATNKPEIIINGDFQSAKCLKQKYEKESTLLSCFVASPTWNI